MTRDARGLNSRPALRRGPLVTLLVVALAACASPPAGAQRAERDATAPAGNDELTRLSGRLRERVDAALRDPCLANARVGTTVRDLETGRTLHDAGGAVPLVPASNQKLVTAAAALTLLGNERVLYTEFRADRPPDDTGDVGRLWIVGAGDPALTVESLHAAARALAAAGVRRVDGVVADSSLFDESLRPATWPERHFPHWYGAPSAALGANFNVVAVHARGTRTGQPAEAWIEPFPSFFVLENELTTGRGAWSVRSELLSLPTEDGRRQALTLVGRVPPDKTVRELRSVEDPPLFTAHAMTDALQRMGVRVAGAPRTGVAPDDAALLHSHPSKPLALLVHDMNKTSSNVFAETLLRLLGAELIGPPGTREKGLAVVSRFLEEVSDEAGLTTLDDGSGLSERNRLTTRLLADVLRAVARDPIVGPEFVVALPVGNVDGTLRRRLGPQQGRRLVRAKTGRLRDVVSLSGYAVVAPEREAVFSVLVNDYSCPTWKVQDAVDRVIGAIVAEAPRAVEPGQRLPVEEIRAALAQQAPPGDGVHDGTEEYEGGGP